MIGSRNWRKRTTRKANYRRTIGVMRTSRRTYRKALRAGRAVSGGSAAAGFFGRIKA